MASGGYDRRLQRPDYDSIKEQSSEEIYSEFVEVPQDMKGHVIGKGGYMLQEIIQMSGARVSSASRDKEGFTVCGNEDQIANAKRLILKKVKDVQSTIWERLEIEDKYKGWVLGKGRSKLKEITAKTGAELIFKGGDVYIIRGNEEQRTRAKVQIGNVVASVRLTGAENKVKKLCYYIDGCNLSEDCTVTLQEVSHPQYNLIPARKCEPQDLEAISSNSNSSYQSKLMEDALVSLRNLKETEEHPKANMWCHFGTAVIRVPAKENVFEAEWSVDEATHNLQLSDKGRNWKMAFRAGVDFDEGMFKENNYKIYENDPYIARYDLTYLTPSYHQLKCKVWVAHENVKGRLEDIKIPFGDVKRVLKKIYFEDEATRSRCRGWLVLKSRRYLQADILFPGCKYDCTRLAIHGPAEKGLASDSVPPEQVQQPLLAYLSRLTLNDKDGFGLHLQEDLPKGFHLTKRRLSKRTLFTTDSGFAVILSRAHTWGDVMGKYEYREPPDLYLHCEEWDRLLSSGVWEPEAIVRKIPEFLTFVREVQGLVGSTGTIPPEILARGPAALEAYNQALAEGKTSDKRVPIMLIEQDRAGKTSLKKSLKEISFDPEENSIVGIEVDPSLFKVTTETWRTGMTKNDPHAEEAISISSEPRPTEQAGAEVRGVENEFTKVCCYVDGWNLTADGRVKLEQLVPGDRMFLPGPQAQYRLRSAEDYGPQDSCCPGDNPSYMVGLKKEALESLRQIKREIETKENLKLDMCCHLGMAIVWGPDEG